MWSFLHHFHVVKQRDQMIILSTFRINDFQVVIHKTCILLESGHIYNFEMISRWLYLQLSKDFSVVLPTTLK